MTSSAKKKKEKAIFLKKMRRKFHENWTNDYFLLEIKNRPMCFSYESISPLKEFNVKWH